MSNPQPAFADWLSDTNEITRLFLGASQIPGLINMAGGLPEPSVFPVASLAKLAEKAVTEHSEETLGYGPIEGLPELRDQIAARFSTPTLQLTRHHVLVTTSGMQGLDLIGKVLLNPGQTIAVQSPAYLGALDAWRPRQPSYRPFFPDQSAFDTTVFGGAQFAYTVPNFSNPTGRLIPLAQRQQMVDTAHQRATWLVEDDPYGTLFYDGEPLPRLLDLSAAKQPGHYQGPVIYLGTVSKQLVPGLRIGWVIAAPPIIDALTVAKQGSDMCTSGLSQRIVLEALAGGLDQHILPTLLRTYRARRDALCAAMTEHLSAWFRWDVPVGGMFVWAIARDPALNSDLLLEAAMQEKVCITPGSVFDPTGADRRGIRINFTLNPPEVLAEGVRRLARATSNLVSR